jgi:hypothetical protein
MSTDSHILHGVVHGKTIELRDDICLPDGQEVTIVVHSVRPGKRLPPGEGIRRSAGGWSDNPEGLDEYLNWSYEQRKIDRPEIGA